MRDALGAVQSVLVLGGGSEIGLATARRLAALRARTIVLAARQPETLEAAMDDLRAAGATTVEAVTFDATDFASHDGLVDDLFGRYGDFDAVVVAFGVLGDQERAEHDGAVAVEIAQTNYTGALSVMVPLVDRLRAQGHGVLVVLSSVAGVRARRSNFVYGSSKAGLDAFCQGLGDSLADSGVQVLIVRPGFVHSRMTAGRPAAPLATTPERVAEAIVDGIARRRSVVWVPGAMRLVMLVLRHVPRPVLRRLPV